MLKTILLTPVILVLALFTTLMAYNLIGVLTVAISRGVGTPFRRLFGITGHYRSIGLLCSITITICTFGVPALILLGMLWVRYGGSGAFFVTSLQILIPAWFIARLVFVIATGEPGAKPLPGAVPGQQGWRRFRRIKAMPSGVLRRRSHTIPDPDGQVAEKGNIFIREQELHCNPVLGPYVVTTESQHPAKEIFPESRNW